MKANPEQSIQPEVSADISTFLARLRKKPADLLVAWALAPDGPKVIAYSVRGADEDALVPSFVTAVRNASAEIRTAKATLAGKDVTVISGITPERGYLYANGDVLYATSTKHTPEPQLSELLSKLP
jgi:hypothetical protein